MSSTIWTRVFKVCEDISPETLAEFRESERERARKWYQENKEKHRESMRQWYEANKDFYKESNKEHAREYGKKPYVCSSCYCLTTNNNRYKHRKSETCKEISEYIKEAGIEPQDDEKDNGKFHDKVLQIIREKHHKDYLEKRKEKHVCETCGATYTSNHKARHMRIHSAS